MSKIFCLLLLLSLLSCSNNEGVDVLPDYNQDNDTIAADTLALPDRLVVSTGVDSVFPIHDSLVVYNSGREFIDSRIVQKLEKTGTILEKEDIKNSIRSGFKLNMNNEIDYYPIAQILINDSVKVLFIEEYINKFPIGFTKVLALVYDSRNNKITDSYTVYRDNNVMIFDYQEISFSWKGNYGQVYIKGRPETVPEGDEYRITDGMIYQVILTTETIVIENLSFVKTDTKVSTKNISLEEYRNGQGW